METTPLREGVVQPIQEAAQRHARPRREQQWPAAGPVHEGDRDSRHEEVAAGPPADGPADGQRRDKAVGTGEEAQQLQL